MCVVKLSVLKGCRHELATIEYCENTMSIWEYLELPPKPGVDLTLPKPCTNSLGWTIYQSLDEPVTCKSCKAWLEKKGKETFGQAKAKLEEVVEELLEDSDSKEGTSVSDMTPEGRQQRAPPSMTYARSYARFRARAEAAALQGNTAARRSMGR